MSQERSPPKKTSPVRNPMRAASREPAPRSARSRGTSARNASQPWSVSGKDRTSRIPEATAAVDRASSVVLLARLVHEQAQHLAHVDAAVRRFAEDRVEQRRPARLRLPVAQSCAPARTQEILAVERQVLEDAHPFEPARAAAGVASGSGGVGAGPRGARLRHEVEQVAELERAAADCAD